LSSYEFAVRHAPELNEWTGRWNGSGSWGAVWAAAAVSSLSDPSPAETWHALEIAEFNAPLALTQWAVRNPGSLLTKDGIGWSCYVGTSAAQFAELGLTGSGTVFDDRTPNGSSLDPQVERYHLLENYYKPYPGCQ
jgi:2-methylcitrate dehydratase PrpD